MKHLKQLSLFIALLPIMALAQSFDKAQDDHSAINWTTGLTWQQVKAKAKKENKYIFVDCFTTWCKPCKEMDQKVYTVDSVGDYLNAGFISVKLQMDETKNDNAAVKSWYKTVSDFNKEYNIAAFPTMLFFTPSGEVATKEVGYKDPGELIATARNSKDPSKQYYVLLKNYKKGKLNDAAKRSLIRTAKDLGDTTNYRSLRDNYLAYMHTLPKEKLYTKENIEFIAGIINKRSQRVIDMFYPDGSAVDKVMEKKGYAKNVVDNVIMKEKVSAVFNAGIEAKTEPDWNSIHNAIAKDYNEDYATRNVLQAKILWYGDVQPDMVKLAASLNDKMEKYGSDTTSKGEDFKLNNAAFLIWKKLGATEKPGKDEIKELTRVINWMEGVVRRGDNPANDYYYTDYWPLYIDTYANLLYKTGRKAEALKFQELAIKKGKELGGVGKGDMEGFEYRFDKMKKGEPSWPIGEEN